MSRTLQGLVVVLLALAIIFSCTFVGNKMTDPVTYTHTIEVLDRNRTTVLGLSAASAAASAAVSTLPDDMCSSIADQLSEFTSWFMMILGFIYLEKYLLTILGAVACYGLFPPGFGALLVDRFFPKSSLRSVGVKFVILGTAVLLTIPSSVWISDQIHAVYSKSIEITVDSANAVSDNLFGETTEEAEEESTVIDKAKELLSDVTGSVAKVIEQFKNVLNRFIEAIAVMIVTTCLIPILVIVFFVWIAKTLFNVPIVVPTQLIKPKKAKHSIRDKSSGADRLPHEEKKELPEFVNN